MIMSAMRTLKTSEAAALRNVSPNTLRAWVLPDTPFGAHRQLLALVDDRRADRFGRRAPGVSLLEDVDDLREAQA